MAAYTRPKYAIFAPLSLVRTEFHEILKKYRNSMETGKFHVLAENSAFRGKL